MADKISLEFEARDEQLNSQIKALRAELESLGDSANYSESLNQNLSSLDANIRKVEALRRSISLATKEVMGLSVNPGGTTKSREKQQQSLDSLRDTTHSAISAYNSTRGVDRPISNATPLKGTPSFYTPRLNEPAIMARQREDARAQLSLERSRYSDLARDAGTNNRSLLQSNRRINTRIQSGGFISTGERITANNNLNNARSILTENGRFSDTNGRINNLRGSLSTNNSLRDSLQQRIKDITGDGTNELSEEQKRTVQQLEQQRELLEKQNQGIKSYTARLEEVKKNYDNLESSLGDQNAKFAPTSGLSGIMFKRSQNIANGIVYGAAAGAGGLAMQGNSIINQEQPLTRAIGANNGTYDSRAAQLSAQRAGMPYGLTGNDMLQSEMAYMQGRGFTGNSDMQNAGVNTGMFAKLNGLTVAQSSALTSVYANNSNGDAQGLKDVQDTFYGALKQAGLTNRSYSQSSQLSSILGNYASARGGQTTTGGLSEQVAMQSALGSTNNSALLGQNGANFMNQMSSSIIGQGANSSFMQLALMRSNPQKYNGTYQGYANIIDQTQNGLDATNLKAITGVSDMVGGNRSSSFFANMLKQNFGVNVTTKTASDIQGLVSSGKLDGLDSKQTITQLQKAGAISSDQAKQMQQGSSDASYDKGQASFEKAATSIGNLTRNISSLALRATGGSAALTILGTAAMGAAATLGKIGLSTGLSNMIKNGTGTGGGSGTGGTGLFGGFGTGNKGAANTETRMGRLAQRTSITGRLANSKPVQAISSGLDTLAATRAGGFVTNTASKATGLFSSVGSKLLPIGKKALNFAGKAAPWAQVGLTGIQAVSDIAGGASKKQIGSDIGGGAGTILGTLLGMPFGPLGMLAGGTIGGAIGNAGGSLIGGLFGNEGSKQKDDESLTNRKIQAETLRSKNIKDDNSFVNKYGRTVNKKDVLKDSSPSNSVSSDDSVSPFENYKNTGANKGSAGSGGTTRVVVSGTVNHTGEVADMSQVNVSVDGVLSNLFPNVNGNETTRK